MTHVHHRTMRFLTPNLTNLTFPSHNKVHIRVKVCCKYLETLTFCEPLAANKCCVYWQKTRSRNLVCVQKKAIFRHLTWFRSFFFFFFKSCFLRFLYVSEHSPQQHTLFTSCLLFG